MFIAFDTERKHQLWIICFLSKNYMFLVLFFFSSWKLLFLYFQCLNNFMQWSNTQLHQLLVWALANTIMPEWAIASTQFNIQRRFAYYWPCTLSSGVYSHYHTWSLGEGLRQNQSWIYLDLRLKLHWRLVFLMTLFIWFCFLSSSVKWSYMVFEGSKTGEIISLH